MTFQRAGGRRAAWRCAAAAVLFISCATRAHAGELAGVPEAVQAVLEDNCFQCHGGGLKKGNVNLDASGEAFLGNRELWGSVLKNVRSGVMPPAGQDRPPAEDVRVLEDWIKRSVFRINLKDPDPGRVTLRRLNRVEYGNTIRDLLNTDLRPEDELPPDDTGYGFDTIGDVLSLSPLLLEKYMQAAESVVAAAVPTTSRVVRERKIAGRYFRTFDNAQSGDGLNAYDATQLAYTLDADQPGRRRIVVELQVRGGFDFDPGRCRLAFRVDRAELLNQEFGWENGAYHRFEYEVDWKAGAHKLGFELVPLTPRDQKKSSITLRVASVLIVGPLEKERWIRPRNFTTFFTQDDPGPGPARRPYAREMIRRFASRAYRRPIDDRTLERLTAIAEDVYSAPGKTVEEGVARALVGVLASPRFLFRVEEVEPGPAGSYPLIDEYALATRLSYFLWSTMPDDALFDLAARHELRKNLPAQIKRMLADSRSNRMVQNFTGQWLQARDVEGISIDARTVLARDVGEEKELKREQDDYRAYLADRAQKAREYEAAKARGESPKPLATFGQVTRRSGRFRRLFAPLKADLNGELRRAMREETELFFGAIVRDNRSVLELIDSDFTYLNEALARHYGIPGVKGERMRRVTLPKDSPRGGLLTQGTMLVVTSNPTRTSPVKRGLFVLDNILGTPAPPPPPDVPQLEEAEKTFKGREPTLREILEVHRQKALCNACHSRMDPLGLALENFNALGMWRDTERGQPLDAGGRLVSGETFDGIRALKAILKDSHQRDFFRCLTEKLLTYALGRGLEYDDVETVDRIVDRLEQENGRFSALLAGVVESAPFQKRRGGPAPGTALSQPTGTSP